MCEEMCAFGEEHSKECQIFSKLPEKLTIEDYSSSHNLYWCITVIRVLSLRDTDPKRYAIVDRMMDHNHEHQKDSDSWNAYKENVVDFLREKCSLADKYSREEIFHVLGSLDVNSVKVASKKIRQSRKNCYVRFSQKKIIIFRQRRWRPKFFGRSRPLRPHSAHVALLY